MAEQHDDATTYTDFREAVNMPPAVLEKWLETADSKRVGRKGEDGDGPGESVGHKSGKRIVAIERTAKADLTADDYTHMRQVIGYLARHLKQRPKGDVEDTDWRYSLMNWGHDPLKG